MAGGHGGIRTVFGGPTARGVGGRRRHGSVVAGPLSRPGCAWPAPCGGPGLQPGRLVALHPLGIPDPAADPDVDPATRDTSSGDSRRGAGGRIGDRRTQSPTPTRSPRHTTPVSTTSWPWSAARRRVPVLADWRTWWGSRPGPQRRRVRIRPHSPTRCPSPSPSRRRRCTKATGSGAVRSTGTTSTSSPHRQRQLRARHNRPRALHGQPWAPHSQPGALHSPRVLRHPPRVLRHRPRVLHSQPWALHSRPRVLRPRDQRHRRCSRRRPSLYRSRSTARRWPATGRWRTPGPILAPSTPFRPRSASCSSPSSPLASPTTGTGCPYGSRSDAPCSVDALVSTDTFGAATLVPAAAAAGGPRPWRMFEHTASVGADGLWLLVPPVLASGTDAAPSEEIRLMQDPAADLAWAVEHIVTNAVGRAVRRSEDLRAQGREPRPIRVRRSPIPGCGDSRRPSRRIGSRCYRLGGGR